ncbi:MAG: inorganic phosphate transporter [Thermodesulfobacteriota bacterium]
MLPEVVVLICGFLVGFYMAWNIGANDVANSMASAVGAKAITLRQAILIAGILNILGAAFIGSHVTDTIRKGIVSTEVLSDPDIALMGAFSALLSASLWVSFATWRSLPVSTTHSIVGSMVGFGIAMGGFSVIHWPVLGAVVLSWLISPVFSLVIGYAVFKLIIWVVLSRSNPFEIALKHAPWFIGLAVFIIAMSFLFKTPLGKTLALSTPTAALISLGIAALLGYGGKRVISYKLDEKDRLSLGAEAIFRRIQIGTSCYVALAHGANDVANAIGPLAVIYFLARHGTLGATVPVPFFLLVFGGIGIAFGISMSGARVIQTVGSRITTLSNTRGFSVDFSAATTVLVASKLGLPVSTTHAAVGGVMGVGLARGFEAVNFGVILKIMLYWVLTVPVAAFTCMGIFAFLRWLL